MCDHKLNGSPFGDSPITIRKGNKMHFKNIKQAYIYGLKEGMVIGIEKGMDLAESWVECEDCPPANSAPMIENHTTTE